MATPQEVHATLDGLIRQFEQVDESAKSMLPNKRLIEARCDDLGLTYHAQWRSGKLGELCEGHPPKRADIRISVNSNDLLALAAGLLTFKQAWSAQQIRIDASMTDMLRLRAALA